MGSRIQVVKAPARPVITGAVSIFLAGTTTDTGGDDWRQTLIQSITNLPVTIFDPKRSDWDSTWKEDFSDERWVEQVQWELDMQEKADIVVVFFHGVSLAPISLLELGLCARSGKAFVCALSDYSKRGNVEAVCRRFGVPFTQTEDELRERLVKALADGLHDPGY